ncbi:hypothetical protein OED01_03280 [Microbacterium sp. M28]|uniref:hypothetical protein n=1 Tax=Microbacterium sp. M28 TaxID=2962064 RepID=UPI0021F490B8|nr:hypothetical protein [Microbacterium sp. M28]UYO97753.1 hypothetical protein OED01_03280 [Microbacterium sp. M28]
MLRRKWWVPMLAVVLVVAAGCAPAATPSPSDRTPDAVDTSTPTPTAAPAGAPQAAFDLSCDDVVFAMTELFGTPSAPVAEHLWLKESPSWYPGPAQYMFARAGGAVCAYDDGETSWQITASTGAQDVLDDLAANGYTDGDLAPRCDDGRCAVLVRDGDILVEATVLGPEITEGDLEPVRAALVGLAAQAAETVEPVEVAPSPIAGAACDQLLAPETLASTWDVPAQLHSEFGGWGIPAAVYWKQGGARACLYLETPGAYDGEHYLTLTTLPAGRWAAELPTGRSAVDIEGADAAYSGEEEYYDDLPFIDIVVGDDWVRVSAPGRSMDDLMAVAPLVAANMTALGT